MDFTHQFQAAASRNLELHLSALRSLWEDLSKYEHDLWVSQFLRWQGRTADTITKYLGEAETANFEAVISAVEHENSGESLALTVPKVENYLRKLLSGVWADARKIKAQNRPPSAKELELPQTVTLKWLANHVPVRLAVGFLGIVASCFWGGLTLGQSRFWQVAVLNRAVNEPPNSQNDVVAVASHEPGLTVSKGADPNRSYLEIRPLEMWENIERLSVDQQKEAIKKDYEGKWIRLRGAINAVDGGRIELRDGGVKVWMVMREDQRSLLETLSKGRVVTMEGRFNTIFDAFISFSESESIR